MARQSIHANDVQFTEDSLKGFIKKVRNNIRDNFMFASTSDMAEKNGNYDLFTDAEKEIANHFENWSTEYAAKICIINKEIPYDEENLENGRYTWIRGGSLLAFKEELYNTTEWARPEGTIFIDENNGTKTHIVQIKGFDGNGNFSNRAPGSFEDYPDASAYQDLWKEIETNLLKADQLGTPEYPIGSAYITDLTVQEISLDNNGQGLYVQSEEEAMRFDGILQDEDQWVSAGFNTDPNDPNYPFATDDIITNIPEYTIAAAEFEVEDVGSAKKFILQEDGYYQSQNTTANSYALCKIIFNTEIPREVKFTYQNTGYSTSNYSLVSILGTTLKQSYAADTTGVALNLSNDFSETDRIFTFNIPAGESFITCKHRITNTSKTKGNLRFKIEFNELTVFPVEYNNSENITPIIELGNFPINENIYYKNIGNQIYISYKSNEYYDNSSYNILKRFNGGPTFDYIGSEPFSEYPDYDAFDEWLRDYNLQQPLWWVDSNRMYVRILSTNEEKALYSYNDGEIAYVSYNNSSKEYEYYKISNVDMDVDFISSIQYTFESIATPENIANFNNPGPAILFQQGFHEDLEIGHKKFSSQSGWTYYIDGITYYVYSGSQRCVIPDYILCPVQPDLINGIEIIHAGQNGNKYLKLDTNLNDLQLKVGSGWTTNDFVEAQIGVNYNDFSATDFYYQTVHNNRSSLLSSDPALGIQEGVNGHHISLEGSIRTNGGIAAKKSIKGYRVHAAVFNDYAEYRQTDIQEPGRCVIELGNGNMTLSSERLQAGANIISDTFGFSIGETSFAQTPIAVCGRVLAYPYEKRDSYKPGDAVCSGPDGTISKMTREEIKEWPDRIVGYVSEIPYYIFWGSEKVEVNGRIWIKIK